LIEATFFLAIQRRAIGDERPVQKTKPNAQTNSPRTMSITRIILITLLISSGILFYALFNLESDTDTEVAEPTASTTDPRKPTQAPAGSPFSEPTPATPAPAAPINADTLDDAQMLPDEMESDEEIEKEQIAAAMAQLNSTKEEDRIEAVEQLGAYPGPETEATLGQLLATDASAEVRNAAALSLGAVDSPNDTTVNSLMTALEDQNEDVRFSALSTLEDFMLALEEDSPSFKKIQSALKAKADARSVPQDTRDAIKEVLQDQQAQSAPAGESAN
jgi:predicted RND superfamily exporter protein